MQTVSFLLFRHESGSQDILSEKPWKLLKKKKCWNHFYIGGKKGNICFFV